jgi:hypothetical protein
LNRVLQIGLLFYINGLTPSVGQAGGVLAGAGPISGLARFAPTPNYITRVKRGEAWKKLPLKVHFVRDANYASARESMARHGFDRWVIATEGLLDYEATDDPAAADIYVVFDAKTHDGLTRTGFDMSRKRKAVITIGVKPGLQTDVEAIAAHEFGHALGIDGHSDSKRDLMYPYHREGAHGRLSNRDINTIAAMYPKVRQLVVRKAGGPKSR